MVCTANWGQSSQRVVAATAPAVEKTIFDGFSDLLAQRDPSEFGDDQPNAPSPQQSNPQAPPFPQDPGPNFPVRPEFDRPQPDVNLNNSQQASAGVKQLDLMASDGCMLQINLNAMSRESSVDSVKFTSPDAESCGTSFTTRFSSDGNRTEILRADGIVSTWEIINPRIARLTNVDVAKSKTVFEYEFISRQVVILTYTDASGRSTKEKLDVPPEFELPVALLNEGYQLADNKQYSKNQNSSEAITNNGVNEMIASRGPNPNERSNFDFCKEFKSSCDYLNKVSNIVSMAQAVTFLSVVGQPALPALGLLDTGLSIAQIPCFIAYGGFPPIPFSRTIKFAGKGAEYLNIAMNNSKTLGRFARTAQKAGERLEYFEGKTIGGNSTQLTLEIYDEGKSSYDRARSSEDSPNKTWIDKFREQQGLGAPCNATQPQQTAQQPISGTRLGYITGSISDYCRRKGGSYGDPNVQDRNGRRIRNAYTWRCIRQSRDRNSNFVYTELFPFTQEELNNVCRELHPDKPNVVARTENPDSWDSWACYTSR